MRVFVVRRNIERYRRMLENERDAARRNVLSTLLVEAEAELERLSPSSSVGTDGSLNDDGNGMPRRDGAHWAEARR